ncbi:MAG: (d)CMP kinase [Armatimonadetes bacterium]|nr:(d)CMP kinase [Armatimonadota bacterium]
MHRRLTIAIDGPMGAGKGTVARLLANRLGYVYVDTGAMYRAIAWKALQRQVDLDDEASVGRLAAATEIRIDPTPQGLRVFCDGEEVTAAIRAFDVNAAVGRVASHPAVRATLTGRAREMGQSGGIVMDGRDIGTVVLPDADVKIYLDATLDERARRRCAELAAKGERVPFETVCGIVADDDDRAMMRTTAPLRQAPGAIRIDSTGRSPEQVADEIESILRKDPHVSHR